MNINTFFKEYIWEALVEAREFNGDFLCENIPSSSAVEQYIRSVHIERDEKYNIRVKAEGMVPNEKLHADDKAVESIPSGTLIKGGMIVCDAMYEGVITLKDCFRESQKVYCDLSEARESKFEAEFRTYEINWNRRMRFEENTEADTVIEWYLNGVESSALFCDSTKIEDMVSRNVMSAEDNVHNLYRKSEHFTRDCVHISFADTAVLVRKVIPDYGPKWSNNIALEYRSSYGRIPDKAERKKIAEFLGFLMGRHLILVGDTAYCNDAILESNMYHPYSKNTVAECVSNTRELIPVHQYLDECHNFRVIAQAFLPAYLEMRDEYGMDSVLERYWLANIMPIGINLPILAGAMETLMKCWFKGKKSKTGGVYMNASQYEVLIAEFLEGIEKSLADCEYKSNIMRKISNAYQMGVNDRYFIFLDELGLKYGEAETSCIKARNAYTHGDSGKDNLDTLQKTKTMFILLGRIILKLLGYDGEYIDETILGFPRKMINEAIN